MSEMSEAKYEEMGADAPEEEEVPSIAIAVYKATAADMRNTPLSGTPRPYMAIVVANPRCG